MAKLRPMEERLMALERTGGRQVILTMAAGRMGSDTAKGLSSGKTGLEATMSDFMYEMNDMVRDIAIGQLAIPTTAIG